MEKLCVWNDLFKFNPNYRPLFERTRVFGNEILFTTSGTTGKRKLVRLSPSELNIAAVRHPTAIDYSGVESALSIMPLFTCYGFVTSVHTPLMLGKKIVIYPIYDFRSFPSVLLKTRANAFFGVISHWEALLKSRKAQKADLSFLKIAYWGGEGCSEERVTKINRFLSDHGCTTKLCQGYGMTETASGAVLQTPQNYIPSSAGKALPLVKLSVVAEGTDIPLPVGETGEICIHTPCQTVGYYNDYPATSELIHTHADGLRWIHSGDLGYLDNEGNLFVVGRIKRMIVTTSGTKVFPSVLEDKVSELSCVSECAAVTLTESQFGKTFKLALFVSSTGAISAKSVKRKIMMLCRKELPAYFLPDKIVILLKLPHTSSGKIDYSELKTRSAGIFSRINIDYHRKLK